MKVLLFLYTKINLFYKNYNVIVVYVYVVILIGRLLKKTFKFIKRNLVPIIQTITGIRIQPTLND